MLGRSLVSWSFKKQNSVALSTAEAEYIATGACCAQILYIKQTLLDYGVVLDKVPLLCDNESAVKLANNPVQHSRTKHIDIRHHFLRDHVAKNDISLEGVRTEDLHFVDCGMSSMYLILVTSLKIELVLSLAFIVIYNIFIFIGNAYRACLTWLR